MTEDAWNIIRRLGGIGILTPEDLPALDSQRGRVLALMADGKWHRSLAILDAAGGTEGLRRMRELRRIPYIDVERQRGPIGRLWLYRLVRRIPYMDAEPREPESYSLFDEMDAMSPGVD